MVGGGEGLREGPGDPAEVVCDRPRETGFQSQEMVLRIT